MYIHAHAWTTIYMRNKKFEDEVAIVTKVSKGIRKIMKKRAYINLVGAASSREAVQTLRQCFRNVIFLSEDMT